MQDRCRRHLVEQGVGGGAIGRLATGQQKGDRTAVRGGERVDLRGSAAMGSDYRLIVLPPLPPLRSDESSPSSCRSTHAPAGHRLRQAHGKGSTWRRMSAPDAVDGSSTGIAMCHIALVIREQQMSPIGTKLPFVSRLM